MDKQLDLKKTALVIIDLQKGIVGREGFAPYSAKEVIEKNDLLIGKLANTEALVVYVHVKNYGGESLKPIADNAPLSAGKLPEDFSDFIQPSAYDEAIANTIHVTKHNWGAFYGTDLDVQLRRRGIDTMILTGIATTIGVDTTAREAFQGGYNLICVEDAMTDFDGTYHTDTIEKTFKRIARVRSTDETLEML
ncbi:MAG: isochorismatase family protein [Streptococcaceae bacterium]|nr:isochorismatase family protein [Streptococcaceae bacterium]MCL2858452.1 isochorismatase family protein [Streptococcaceae bacterium]